MVCKTWYLFICSIGVFVCVWYGLIGLTGVGTCSDVLSVFGCGDCGRCFLFVDLLLEVGGFGV